MAEIEALTENFVERCQLSLSERGRLFTAVPGFTSRPEQIQLATEIAKTIENKALLVAEAGTGTGKTFAYLVPALLSGKSVLLSTATKTLQDQLFDKDLPLLLKALGLSARVQNLKGRANYLCRYRTELHTQEGRFSSQKHGHEIHHISEKLSQLKSGERGELPEISEASSVWPDVTSTVDNCLGKECPYHDTCFLVKARKKALEADIVVINHHLYFADHRLKKEGFSELLPGVETVIFDEAHQLLDIATQFYSERVSTRQFRELMNDVLKEWPVLDLVNQPLKQYSLELDRVIDTLMMAVPEKEERVNWVQLVRQNGFIKAKNDLVALVEKWRACFDEEVVREQSGLKRCFARLQELERLLHIFETPGQGKIFWVERFKYTLVFQATPIEIAERFSSLMDKQSSAFIFTSATLTTAGSFHYFTKPLGISEQAKQVIYSSPFEYSTQALLYLPRSLPDPKEFGYYDALLLKVLPIIQACGGRCFFLFTSHKALRLVATMLETKLDLPLLIQGEEAKPILLSRFRALGNAVLLGTGTFWEGVDVKGQALSCVIIDKLPFASPSDPVIRGRMDHLKSQNVSGFDALSLPNAILALKQGVGRLIRDIDDKGVMMIADPRLTGRPYGKKIFESLPNMRRTRDEKSVLAFIKTLALEKKIFDLEDDEVETETNNE